MACWIDVMYFFQTCLVLFVYCCAGWFCLWVCYFVKVPWHLNVSLFVSSDKKLMKGKSTRGKTWKYFDDMSLCGKMQRHLPGTYIFSDRKVFMWLHRNTYFLTFTILSPIMESGCTFTYPDTHFSCSYTQHLDIFFKNISPLPEDRSHQWHFTRDIDIWQCIL